MQPPEAASRLSPAAVVARFALIAAVLASIAAAFAYVGGWLSPQRLTPARFIDALQGGKAFPGFRRNHAKGVCVSGEFESSGAASQYSTAALFKIGKTPLVGRFALPSPNPYAADSSAAIRSFALRFTQADGEQWRTGMNAMPIFPVGTPDAFYAMLKATAPDPSTGKPDPAKAGAFFGSHPETAAFLAWAKTAKPSASYATETYNSINAFYLKDTRGQRHAVRWSAVPEDVTAAMADAPAPDEKNYLEPDIEQRLAKGPLRWHLLITLANPGDPTADATKAWPDDRTTIDAGTIVLTRSEPQGSGQQSSSCRDINYDPTVLPAGIEISDDPLLPARSAAYANSYLRRTSEEAHLPGTEAPAPTKSPSEAPQ